MNDMKVAATTDRVILLKARDGAKSSTGLVDPRLFTGENKLHAKMDASNCLWYVKYEHGAVPQPLKQQWTNFTLLNKSVKEYFERRGVDVIGTQN